MVGRRVLKLRNSEKFGLGSRVRLPGLSWLTDAMRVGLAVRKVNHDFQKTRNGRLINMRKDTLFFANEKH